MASQTKITDISDLSTVKNELKENIIFSNAETWRNGKGATIKLRTKTGGLIFQSSDTRLIGCYENISAYNNKPWPSITASFLDEDTTTSMGYLDALSDVLFEEGVLKNISSWAPNRASLSPEELKGNFNAVLNRKKEGYNPSIKFNLVVKGIEETGFSLEVKILYADEDTPEFIEVDYKLPYEEKIKYLQSEKGFKTVITPIFTLTELTISNNDDYFSISPKLILNGVKVRREKGNYKKEIHSIDFTKEYSEGELYQILKDSITMGKHIKRAGNRGAYVKLGNGSVENALNVQLGECVFPRFKQDGVDRDEYDGDTPDQKTVRYSTLLSVLNFDSDPASINSVANMDILGDVLFEFFKENVATWYPKKKGKSDEVLREFFRGPIKHSPKDDGSGEWPPNLNIRIPFYNNDDGSTNMPVVVEVLNNDTQEYEEVSEVDEKLSALTKDPTIDSMIVIPTVKISSFSCNAESLNIKVEAVKYRVKAEKKEELSFVDDEPLPSSVEVSEPVDEQENEQCVEEQEECEDEAGEEDEAEEDTLFTGAAEETAEDTAPVEESKGSDDDDVQVIKKKKPRAKRTTKKKA